MGMGSEAGQRRPGRIMRFRGSIVKACKHDEFATDDRMEWVYYIRHMPTDSHIKRKHESAKNRELASISTKISLA
jgi:hypothetical protein